MADHDNADASEQRRSHQQTPEKVTEEEAQAAGGFKERRASVMSVAGELEEKTSRKRHKFVAGLTASRGHCGHPTVHSKFILRSVCVISRATDGTVDVCVREERETESVLAPPHSSRQSVHPPSLRSSSSSPSVQLVRQQVLHGGSRLLPLRLSNRRKAGRKGPVERNVKVWETGS